MSKPAARLGDMHTCPLLNPGPVPHVGGPVAIGNPTVLIGGMPAAALGDMCICTGPPDAIAMGAPTVLIGGKPAATLGSTTVHGGSIVIGCPTVLIGTSGGGGGGGGGGATVVDPVKKPKALKLKKDKGKADKAKQLKQKFSRDKAKAQQSQAPEMCHYPHESGGTANPTPGRNLCQVPAPITSETCTNGCPISMVTGEELLEQTDFTLSGPLPLVWKRTYRTSNPTDNLMGYGWSHPLNERLDIHEGTVKYFNQEGREIIFPQPEAGSFSRNITTDLILAREKDNLYCLTDKNGLKKTFIGEQRAYLYLIQDTFENTIQIQWGNQEKPTQVVTSWGKMLWITHTSNHRIESIIPGKAGEDKPSQSPLMNYEYDIEGDMIRATDQAGGSFLFKYHNHMITQRTMPNGLSFYFEWDKYEPTGKCLHTWADGGLYEYHFEWFPEENRTISTDSRGARFEYEYNHHGKIIREVDPYGNETLTDYNDAGKIVEKVDPAGASTEYEYDDNDNLIAVTDSEGNVHQIEYDEAGRPVKLIDPLGNEWQRAYNSFGKLALSIDPLGNQTQYHYSAMGLPSQIINAKGEIRTLEWDQLGRLTAETDFAGNRSVYGYDDNDNISAIQNPDGKTTQYRYDQAGRVESAVLPDGRQSRIEYDQSGNITGITDAAGRTTRFEYGGMTQLKKRIDPNGQILEYLYDTEENLIGLKNEKGELYQLHYDLNENLIEEIGFDGRVQKYEYNAAGRLIKYQQGDDLPETVDENSEDSLPPVITQFTRNSLGQLLATQNTDGSGNEFAYDPLGRLISAVNPHRELAFAYDERGLLVEEKQDDQALTHQYDELGRRINTLLPDGQKLDFKFDALGAYESIHLNDTLLTQVKRDQLGREVARLQGATVTEQQYDRMGRLSQIKTANRKSRQVIIQRDYGYDAAGNLSFVNDLKKGETRFHYDALNRLTTMQGVIDETFAHDPAGNILNHNGETAQVGKGNRLNFQGDRHYEYDDRGNLVKERRGKGGQITTEFEYNDQNQLIKVTKGKQETEYHYDALGRRISKKDSFGETNFLWNGNQLLSETRGEIHKTYLFEPGGFRPLAFIQDAKVYHYHVDHLGTPQEISNEQGEIVWSVQYRAYGNVVKKEIEQVENNLRFQGQYFDEETGLHYNRFRYYSPDTGRFINQDPIGLLGGINNYQYAPNPVGWVDPLGLSCKNVFKTQDEAARAVTESINPTSIKENREYGGMIFQRPDGTFGYTGPIKGTLDGVDPGGPSTVPSGTKAVAYWHTHGGDEPGYDSENFSNAYDPVEKDYYGDIPYADYHQIDGYLGTPKGKFKRYSHADKKTTELQSL